MKRTKREMNQTDDNNNFHKLMHSLTLLSVIIWLIFAFIYQIFRNEVFLTFAITFGTIFYHFIMRLIVGFCTRQIRRDFDYNGRWFRKKKFEDQLYKSLKVKRWKDMMPTYNPSTFSLQQHSPKEIIRTMCISELGHEINIVLSFVPLSFALLWGAFPVFLITSVAAAFMDAVFVVMQRYNRPRMIRMMEKFKGLSGNSIF